MTSGIAIVSGGGYPEVLAIKFDPFAITVIDGLTYDSKTPPISLSDSSLLFPNCGSEHRMPFTLLGMNQDTYQVTPEGSTFNIMPDFCSCVSTLMTNGRVFMLCDEKGGDFGKAWLYDPEVAEIRETSEVRWSWSGQSAISLPDGRVAIVGGICNCSGELPTNHEYPCQNRGDGGSRECGCQNITLFDPIQEVFSIVPVLQLPRLGASWSLLSNGRFLVYGGKGTLGCDGYKTYVGIHQNAEVIEIP